MMAPTKPMTRKPLMQRTTHDVCGIDGRTMFEADEKLLWEAAQIENNT